MYIQRYISDVCCFETMVCLIHYFDRSDIKNDSHFLFSIPLSEIVYHYSISYKMISRNSLIWKFRIIKINVTYSKLKELRKSFIFHSYYVWCVKFRLRLCVQKVLCHSCITSKHFNIKTKIGSVEKFMFTFIKTKPIRSNFNFIGILISHTIVT